jgi:predicted GNAT family N-acyltransferase
MKLTVEKITDKESIDEALKIRQLVFVVEQNVDPEKETDEFEDSAFHFLARMDGMPVGAARWRMTAQGVKLERFAVLKESRGYGIGQALVAEVLRDIQANPTTKGKVKYLHAQLGAIPLYEKFGFEKAGAMFVECDIQHYKMYLA